MTLNAIVQRAKATIVVARPRVLAPTLAPYRPMDSPFAAAVRDTGAFSFLGRIGSWTEQEGQTSTSIGIQSAMLAATTGSSGGQAITLTVDTELARYLPPRTRVRVTIEVLDD